MAIKNVKYFLWMLLHVIIWLAAMSEYIRQIDQDYWRLLGLSGYFVCYFLIPLFDGRKPIIASLLSICVVLSLVTLYPQQAGTFHPYIVLIFVLLTAEMAHRLHWSTAIIPALLQVLGLGLLAMRAEFTVLMYAFIVFFMLLLFTTALIYNLRNQEYTAIRARYDALIMEFRQLKRRLSSEEELVRQDERKLIGHEIHDSVGHKLTALIMQLESMRLQAESEPNHQEQVQLIKQLAQDSLDETRRAVQTFKHSEVGGLQGIIRLIRRLESDTFLRVRFTVDHGAFSAPLTGEQSFIIYRSVQEALTNIMKHSKAREARIVFEVPGGAVFRFEISNPLAESIAFEEGFGLTSMRERLQGINGDLDVFATTDQFIVRGWVQLDQRRDDNDD